MENITVDARGKLCPGPLIMTKKQLNQTALDTSFVVLIDNETSKENVERFLGDNQITFQTSVQAGVYSIQVTKSKAELSRPQAEEYCRPAQVSKAGFAICFTGDQMGQGPEELGKILIQGCINTIKELAPLPAAIVFYNSAVKLAADDSPVLDALQELGKLQIKILVCGTCANFFQIKEKIRVGIISNMYDILETLSQAEHVIYP
jgi:selenium metabolism protein YedF